MKLLWVVRLAEGGILNHLSQLLTGIGEHDVVIAGPSMLAKWAGEHQFMPLEIADKLDLRRDYEVVKELRRVVRLEKPDVVHAHGLKAALVTVPAVRWSTKSHLVFTAHNSLPQPKSIFTRLGYGQIQKRIFGAMDLIISVSDAVRDQLVHYVPQERVITIRNGISTDRFVGHSKQEARSLLQLSPTSGIIGTVARLISAKGISTLIEATSLVAKLIPDLHLVVVGEGPERAKFEAYAQALGLQKHVHFLGWRNDVPQLMAGWDCFVLPSYSEGFSLSILEAMAAKLPIVASNLPAMQEAVVPSRSGYLVPPGNAPELAAAVLNILKDPVRARAMGEFNHERVKSLFGHERMVQCTKALYEGLGTI